MRISLVGDFSHPDEARKVMAHHLLQQLSTGNDVMPYNVNNVFSGDHRKELKAFRPDIIQYIPGASTYSFYAARSLKATCKGSKTVMFTALHGFHGFSYGMYYGISSITRPLIRLMKTDLVMVQSPDARKIFGGLGCNVKNIVYSGVDIEKYRPVTAEKKAELRTKYGVAPDKFTVLHVGSVRKWRNVGFLQEIRKHPEIQLVLVGRTSTKFEGDVAEALQSSGIKIINDYTPDINELYQLSDCYVFPTVNPIGSIDVPLSVLEAMSTNLPVVTTRFGGLPDMFHEGSGLVYADEAGLISGLREIKDSPGSVNTRTMVMPYSWGNITKTLESIYRELLK